MEPDDFSFLQNLGQPQQKKRKRGGLAGIWDRNKNIITPLATGAIGMIPGVGVPLASAAGAAMRGFDRPGKKGIGFDVGQAARGALSGYGMGKIGQAVGSGVSKLLGPSAVPAPPDAAARMAAIGKQKGIETVAAKPVGSPVGMEPMSSSVPMPSAPRPDLRGAMLDAPRPSGFGTKYGTAEVPDFRRQSSMDLNRPLAQGGTGFDPNAAWNYPQGVTSSATSDVGSWTMDPLIGKSRANTLQQAVGRRALTEVPTPFNVGPVSLPPLDSSAAPSIQRSFLGELRGRAGNLAGSARRGLGSVLNFTRENPEAVGMGLQAAASIMGSQSQRRIDEERMREERRRAENLARFVLPMYMQGMGGR